MLFFPQKPLIKTQIVICIPHGEKQDKMEASSCKIKRYKNLIFN